jgi:hypothetical protein
VTENNLILKFTSQPFAIVATRALKQFLRPTDSADRVLPADWMEMGISMLGVLLGEYHRFLAKALPLLVQPAG